MNCAESHQLLQRRLDGEALADRTALDRHLAGCPDCRSLHASAGRLEDGLRLLVPPCPPPNLKTRIVARVVADQRARLRLRRRVLTLTALAAGLFLAVLATLPGADGNSWVAGSLRAVREYLAGTSPTTPPLVAVTAPDPLKNPEHTPEPQTPSPSLRASVAEASLAVVGLTRRAADETVLQTKILLPDVPMTPKLPGPETGSEKPVQLVWQQTGQGVSSGLLPVANSARRAFSLFVRDTSGVVEDR